MRKETKEYKTYSKTYKKSNTYKKYKKQETVKVTAIDVKKALAGYHMDEFFITECKNGGTYLPPAQGLLKFDALTIRKSWTRPRIRIYEIKVSRSDFERDGKYHLYKQYCHEFCFACPTGLIKKEELPDDVGLVYFNPETNAIRQVKKPLYNDIEYNADMLMYILMNRVDSDRIPFYGNDREQYAKDYLANKADKKKMGKVLGTKMAEEISELKEQLDKLKDAAEALKAMRETMRILREHGESIWRYDQVPQILERHLNNGTPPEMEDIKYYIRKLNKFVDKMDARDEKVANDEKMAEDAEETNRQ